MPSGAAARAAGPLAAGLIHMAVSRNREFQADTTGAQLSRSARPGRRAAQDRARHGSRCPQEERLVAERT